MNRFAQMVVVAGVGLAIGLAAERLIPREQKFGFPSIRGAGTIVHHSLHTYCDKSLDCKIKVNPVIDTTAKTCTALAPYPLHAHPSQKIVWDIIPLPNENIEFNPGNGIEIDQNTIDPNVVTKTYFYACSRESKLKYGCKRNVSTLGPGSGPEGKSNALAYNINLIWHTKDTGGNPLDVNCKVDPLIISRG